MLIHDAQHTSHEFSARAHFGHSTIGYAVRLGAAAGVGRVVLFHHDPSRSDDELDAIAAELAGSTPPVIVAAEGMVFDL